MPVFITETGWSARRLSEESISNYYATAFSGAWSNSDVVAVIPFVLNYQEELFSEFSWKRREGSEKDFNWYDVVRGLPKSEGNPEQNNKVTPVKGIP